MRISDWSSDVCSSDLPIGRHDSRRKSMMHHEESALEPKLAATTLLLRDEPEFQVLMVKRHQQIDFASGALVFPGGKLHDRDADPAWAEHCTGWPQFDEVQRKLRIAAHREVFEEAGILLAHQIGRAHV